MTKTTLDIASQALQMIGVLAVGEAATADDFAHAKSLFEAEFDRVETDHGFTWTFTADTVPDAVFLPFSSLCAAVIAPTYSVQGPQRSGAIAALRSYYFPDDKADDRRDIDKDGTISDAEKNAGLRAQFY